MSLTGSCGRSHGGPPGSSWKDCCRAWNETPAGRLQNGRVTTIHTGDAAAAAHGGVGRRWRPRRRSGLLIEQLGHPDAVLACDETGFLKKGVCSVGVQRQYTGTAGRVENSQVGVFLAYVSREGRALIDRRLYLPETTWCQQPDRLAAAGVPDQVGFATKPALARQTIAAARDDGVPFAWVTGDEVYGADLGLRADLQHRGIGCVLAVGCDRRVHINDGRTLIRVDELAERIPRREWQQRSCGPGAKGSRDYLWAWITAATQPGEHRWLLIRRNRSTGELAFYLCWSPRPVPLHTLVRVAGSRWSIEELFQTGKGQVGLDRLPSPRLARLAPLRHPGHARPGSPDHPRRPHPRQTHPPPRPVATS